MGNFPLVFPAVVGGDEPAGPATPNNSGIDNLTTAQILKRFLSPALKGPAWDALLAAIAEGDDYKKETLRAAYNQLWLSTAEDKYLVARASDVGIEHPSELGISDDNFRQLAIALNAEKLTLNAILRALEVLYGVEALRAQETSVEEPFILTDGQQLIFETEEGSFTITFDTADFQDIGQATAIEVAEVINRQLRLQRASAFAISWEDADGKYVRLYSGALGLKGFVRVLGGQALNILQFIAPIDVDATGVEWTISKDEDVLRFTADINPGLEEVFAGDYVSIFGTEFHSNNRGSFEIAEVFVSDTAFWFEIENPSGLAEVVEQVAEESLLFYRPAKSTVDNGERVAVAIQPSYNNISVKIPATTVVVNREPTKAAYFVSPSILDVAVLTRTSGGIATLETDGDHGLSVGDYVIVEDVLPDTSAPGTDGGGGVNGVFRVESTPSSDTFTYSTPDHLSAIDAVYSGGHVIKVAAEENSTAIGPYLLDPNSGVGITGVKTTTTMDIASNYQYTILTVADASEFPDEEGWLVINLGYENQAGPIPYKARISPTQLLLDYSFIFPSAIASGASVALLAQKGPWVPADPESAGLAYVTASNAGLAYSKKIIEAITACGPNLFIDVSYPGDRGLGAEGYPETGPKVTDAIWVWGSDSVDAELEDERDS